MTTGKQGISRSSCKESQKYLHERVGNFLSAGFLSEHLLHPQPRRHLRWQDPNQMGVPVEKAPMMVRNWIHAVEKAKGCWWAVKELVEVAIHQEQCSRSNHHPERPEGRGF